MSRFIISILLSVFGLVYMQGQTLTSCQKNGAPDKPCGVGRADANPKLLLNDT